MHVQYQSKLQHKNTLNFHDKAKHMRQMNNKTGAASPAHLQKAKVIVVVHREVFVGVVQLSQVKGKIGKPQPESFVHCYLEMSGERLS